VTSRSSTTRSYTALFEREPRPFRRSLIAHYIDGNGQTVARYYHPALRMEGTVGESEQGGPCGRWVTEDGAPRVELTGYELVGRETE